MWFFDALASGFTRPTDPGRLQLFRIIFGTVLMALLESPHVLLRGGANLLC
ncbi:hypothetical protein [Streptomyces albogriseolus]|uniref:hypothetical protein n=1 Tax=Streptomyces albogriseolus TaxID=1887 RepID=UPI003461182C